VERDEEVEAAATDMRTSLARLWLDKTGQSITALPDGGAVAAKAATQARLKCSWFQLVHAVVFVARSKVSAKVCLVSYPGSRTKPGQDVSFIRHVPKFLQAHAHMLGKPAEEEPEAAVLNQKFDESKSGRDEDTEDDDKASASVDAVEC
jgi:hypothetical protein